METNILVLPEVSSKLENYILIELTVNKAKMKSLTAIECSAITPLKPFSNGSFPQAICGKLSIYKHLEQSLLGIQLQTRLLI